MHTFHSILILFSTTLIISSLFYLNLQLFILFRSYIMKKRLLTQQTREQVIRNITNDSTSKVSWSFSKDPRFKTQSSYCPQFAYDIKLSTISNRKTNFGYGKRTDFKMNNHFVPSPLNYNVKGEFQKKQKKGKSFGISRQKVQIISYINLQNLKVPGPGEYGKQIIQNPSKGFTMRPKTANQRNYFIDDKEQKVNPGPGRYENQVDKMGRASLSKFKSALTPNLLNSTSSRWARLNTNPGPGNYLQKVDRYVLSGQKQNPILSIPKQSRISFTENMAKNAISPGPGNYQLPSDFGHYKRIKTQNN